MKTEKLRQSVDTLYILGAGASYALSEIKVRSNKFSPSVTPLDKDFLQRLSEFPSSRGWRKKSLDIIKSEWLDHQNLIEHGLEEAIIKRVSQFEFLTSLHQRRTNNKIDNPTYLNHLTHLITDYLLTCKSNTSGHTKQFIDTIFQKGVDPKDYKNRIITFNYDTLIERPLIERSISKKKIYFDRIANKQADGQRRNANEKFLHPLILKLHGSINWRCSQENFEKMISGSLGSDAKIDVWTEDKSCPNPIDATSPLIIPPIPDKPITSSKLFLHLWTTAYEYLHEAKEIVIVGYSCPLTDTLARTLFTHFESKKVKKITVVDPDTNALARYRSLMIPKVASSAKWAYFSNFSEYIDHEL